MILFRIALKSVAVVLTLAIAVLVFTMGRVWWVARQDDRRPSDVIVVLGAAQFDGRPSSVFTARLVRIATEEGRRTRPDLKVGVCGEHGGDPESVHFFHEVGLDYVSCSPFRVPVARLEAGRAAIESEGSDSR